MKTAVRQLIEKLESEFSNSSIKTIISLIKSYESVQDEYIKTAYLHGKINGRISALGNITSIGSDEYFDENWNN